MKAIKIAHRDVKPIVRVQDGNGDLYFLYLSSLLSR